MYGSMAPGQTWQQTFLNIRQPAPPPNFVALPLSDPLFSMGSGIVNPNPPKPKPSPKPSHSGGGGGGGHGGGGHGGGGGGG